MPLHFACRDEAQTKPSKESHTLRNAASLVLACLLLIASSVAAEAQQVASSFDQLRMIVKSGERVTVTDPFGRTIKGRIARRSASDLELVSDDGGSIFTEAEVMTIKQQRHSSLPGGAGAGLVIGGLLGGVLGAIAGASGNFAWQGALFGAGYFGAIGTGVGVRALTTHQKTIFSRTGPSAGKLTIVPLATQKRRGVQVTYGF